MKIKSLLACNASLIVDGKRITLPAKPSILELDDKEYAAFIPRLKKLVEEESAKWVKKPTVSKEDQAKLDAEALAAAEALVAASKKAK